VCSVKIATSVGSAVVWPSHRFTIVLPLVYCPVDNTLFEASPEIRWSDVSVCYCCCGNHAAGSKKILKLFIVSIKTWIRSLSTKNNYRKRCELVKLCHINHSSPIFLKHSVLPSTCPSNLPHFNCPSYNVNIINDFIRRCYQILRVTENLRRT